jgi:hypothetical protein
VGSDTDGSKMNRSPSKKPKTFVIASAKNSISSAGKENNQDPDEFDF